MIQNGLRAALLAGALLWMPMEALAQVPRPPRPAARDTAAADTARPPAREIRPDAAADSVLDALRRLQGFSATEYTGETAVYRADAGTLRLEGSAKVDRQGQVLTADTILYNQGRESIVASGRPQVTGQAQELTGSVLYYDLARRRATALGARTQVTEQGTWFVTGDVTLEGAERVYAAHGRFTTCDLEIPHYHFESDQIKVVKGKYLVARPARLYFGNVPVMVLPFVVQNLEQGRRSGLVVPRFSINDIIRTNSGYTRQISDVGWYWAISDYLGAQLTGTWRSEAYVGLQGTLDWRWRRQFLDGRASFQRFWRDTGEREFNLRANSGWKPDERTDLQLDASYASSSEFIRQSTYDPRETTQDLVSNLGVTRRFDWGTVGFSADRRQSISDGSVAGTLPRLTISPRPLTLFRSPSVEQASWYSNATLQWNFSGQRSFNDRVDLLRSDSTGFERARDDTRTQFNGGIQSFTMGNLNLSLTGSLNQTLLEEVVGTDSLSGDEIRLSRANDDDGQWQASIGYQQQLIGQTTLTPNLSLSQQFRRPNFFAAPDSTRALLTEGDFYAAPMRMSFGASLGTALFGFFPGVGPYSGIRHRISPSISYSYAPEVVQTPLQTAVFGRTGGLAQNVVSLSLNQTFEAKLRERNRPEAADTLAGDSAAAQPTTPLDPQKVTLLSLNTSAIGYDFERAGRGEPGFTTTRLSNVISSDYLKGLTIQMEHELFDQSGLDPSRPESVGQLGVLAPRLSSLSTAFELGPNTAVVAWLDRLFGANDTTEANAPTQGVFPGDPQNRDVVARGTGAATGNPLGTGGGPWRAALQYSFSRPARSFNQGGLLDDRPVQTIAGDLAFALTPNWSVNWTTDYSITDYEFGTHRLNFKRDLHRWQANFNFYKTPNGNSAFEFYVELIDNPELKVDYRERNLGIDRPRR